MWIAYGVMWVSTALAACVGVYFTHSPWCLWALLIPACVRISQEKKTEKDEKKGGKGEK